MSVISRDRLTDGLVDRQIDRYCPGNYGHPSVDVWWVGRSMNPTAQKEAGSRRTTQNIKTIRNIVACFLVQPVNIYIYIPIFFPLFNGHFRYLNWKHLPFVRV